MKNFTFILILFLILYSNSSKTQIITDEYGIQNSNSVLGGLGLSASFVNIPSQTAFNIDTAGTLEMWIYPTSFSGNNMCMISKGASANLSFLFGLSGTSARLYLRIGTTDILNIGGSIIPLNQWSHVAVTWNGGPSYNVSFYINGVLSGTTLNNVSATFNVNTDAVRIGNSQAFSSYAFQGNIDEVRIWRTAKTMSQIICNRFIGLGDWSNANQNNTITSGSFYSGLVSSWTFNSSGIIAYDFISNFNGNYIGSAAPTPVMSGVPMPYNFAMKFPGGQYDYIVIPNSSYFNRISNGTLEMWLRPFSFSTEQILISKGSSISNLSFVLGITPATGKLYFGTGTTITINSTGSSLDLNQWNHIAVTWNTTGANFEVRFYKNGVQNGSVSSLPLYFPTNSSSAWLGNSALYNLPFKGYIDEIRLWDPALNQQQIQQNMFVSGRSISSSSGLLGDWNFDGNLINIVGNAGINASFSNGYVNNCRFSAYLNDSLSGAYNQSFQSHSTVINRTGSPNPFPGSYYCKYPFRTIPDNVPAGIADSLIITGALGFVSSVEIFLSVQHTYIGDLIFSLTAPNGVTRNLTINNAGSGKNILTFISDDFTYLPTSTIYLPPWGFLKPIASLGNFGGSIAEGTWVLKSIDNVSGDIGILQGWGLKFNTISGVKQISKMGPEKYMLYQNYPNPFNPFTKIKFDIPFLTEGLNEVRGVSVSLKIFDIIGKEVMTLVNEKLLPGTYDITFNGSKLTSGVYFYKLQTDNFSDTKKLILVK